MAICPNGAIEIYGRTLSPDQLFELPPKANATNYNQLSNLLKRCRSSRDFKNKPVSEEDLNKILEAAMSAPMGLPPSDVNVMVLDGREKTRAFAEDFTRYLKSLEWYVSPLFHKTMRPFWGKANDEMFKDFIRPLFKVYIEQMDEGVNPVNYDAPLAIYFYGSSYSDPADPIITATYAMIAAESLGLGTCMLGAVHPFIQQGKKAK